MPCDPNTLLHDARCFDCLTEDQRAIINLSLLCQIANASGAATPIEESLSDSGGIGSFALESVISGGAQFRSTTDSGNVGYALDSVVMLVPIQQNEVDGVDAGFALQSVVV